MKFGNLANYSTDNLVLLYILRRYYISEDQLCRHVAEDTDSQVIQSRCGMSGFGVNGLQRAIWAKWAKVNTHLLTHKFLKYTIIQCFLRPWSKEETAYDHLGLGSTHFQRKSWFIEFERCGVHHAGRLWRPMLSSCIMGNVGSRFFWSFTHFKDLESKYLQPYCISVDLKKKKNLSSNCTSSSWKCNTK